jgi:hypothetical protein
MSDYIGEFIVSATVNGEQFMTIPVSTRTAYEAERRVWQTLNRDPFVVTFSIDLVREVRMAWNPESGRYNAPVVRVPDFFAHAITINHR